MHAEQVIDMQADLVKRLDTDKKFRAYLKSALTGDSKWLQDVPDSVGTAMYTALVENVRAAYAYRVTPDMCSMVEFAASQLDDTDRFTPNMMPTGTGIVRFERPLPMKDVRGRTMDIHWLIWGPTRLGTLDAFGRNQSGTGLWWFNDTDDPDEVSREIIEKFTMPFVIRTIGRWGFIGAEAMFPRRRMGPALRVVNPANSARILADGAIPTEYTNAPRFAMALWLLLNQTITDVSEEHLRTGRRKNAQKMGIPSRVSVIQLRRIAGVNRKEGESLVQWSHRWVVRGFWRWQPCGEGRTERRRIWIRPFVKGPADMPLIITDKVYELRR